MASYPPDLEEYVEQKVQSGEFRSRDDFAAEAARLYRELEERHRNLKSDVIAALDEASRGESERLDLEALKQEILDAIIQGEGLELSEVPREKWSGQTHPGRLRFQTFRPGHSEPLTDALIGQGMMSVGGGGYGSGGLPYPTEVLQLWGGEVPQEKMHTPAVPTVVDDDGSGEHQYAIVALGPQGLRTTASPPSKAGGLATLRWDSVPGADSYLIVRDGKQVAGPLRTEGAVKEWTDKATP